MRDFTDSGLQEFIDYIDSVIPVKEWETIEAAISEISSTDSSVYSRLGISGAVTAMENFAQEIKAANESFKVKINSIFEEANQLDTTCGEGIAEAVDEMRETG